MAHSVDAIHINSKNLDHARWWGNVWRDLGFESWADAHGWLWDEYKAQVYKTKQGFDIRFLYLDDATLFRLKWL